MGFASLVRALITCAALSAAALATVTPARADPTLDSAAAEEHFARGESAFGKGDFAAAAQAFEAAYAADPHPISLFNAARSWERAGEMVPAANLYRRFLQESSPDTANRDRAIATLADLTKKLGRIEVVAAGGRDVALDDHALGSDATLYTTPGSHLASATFDGRSASKAVDVEPGQSVTVVVEAPTVVVTLPRSAQRRPPAVDQPAAASKNGVTPWLFVGCAGATAVAGGLLIWSGVQTVMDYDTYQGLSDVDKRLTYDGGKFQQDMTNVLIGVTSALGLVTAGVGLFAIDWGHGPAVTVGPSEVRVVGDF